MGASKRLCAQLIDEVDSEIATTQQSGDNGSRIVLSRSGEDGPKTEQFSQKKNRLLAAMRETFIEPRTKSLRMSELLIFCYQNGVQLVTQNVTSCAEASFLLRTSGFDLIVESL